MGYDIHFPANQLSGPEKEMVYDGVECIQYCTIYYFVQTEAPRTFRRIS